ncbi:hypothetical protein EVAR_38178_1 [Eumeta japonica]|uniref:Uncharacterized protein n=1 Tax=Eumeta variegata TaxID=151549 RepID=A0A4C1WEX6_EUMVA|nr:hypothetical protein EVAR_38178_1 [Eumeta japonica]
MPKPPGRQCTWDEIGNKATLKLLLEEGPNATNKARLRATLMSEFGAAFHALPSPNFSTLLDANSLRVAVTLRSGCNVCEPHLCICGSTVEANGYHGLNCQRSSCRFPRHHALHDTIRRALISANVLYTLELPGFSRLNDDSDEWVSNACTRRFSSLNARCSSDSEARSALFFRA